MKFKGRDLEQWSMKVREASDVLRAHYEGTLTSRRAWLGEPLAALDETQQLDHAWSIYAGGLRTVIAGGAQMDNLQLVTVPAEVRWDDDTFGPYYFHHESADLINALGPTYEKTANSFAARYWAFLQDVTRPDVDEDELSKAKEALQKAQAAETEHATVVDSINLEWRQFDQRQVSSSPPSSWVTMDEWFESRNKNAVIRASEEILLGAWAIYLGHIQKAFKGSQQLYDANHKFLNYGKQTCAVPGIGNRPRGKTTLFGYQISNDYQSWIERARKGENQRTKFTVRHDSYTYNYSRTEIGGGIGIGFGFFGLVAGAHRSTVSVDSTREGFTLDFEADLSSFDITPDASDTGWFDSTMFELYGDGPFYPNSPCAQKAASQSLFGPRGFLSFRPASAIVAYKPRVKVTLVSEQYHYFRQVTSGGGLFCIGPFVVGGGGGSSEQVNVSWNDNDCSFELYSGLPKTYLLAFNSQPVR
ncbi:MAG: hypothetical protein JO257_10020 [Deltaproteobacteria bacterium]|nr:hypothetical protein [Deltaproteobacteria bacterium]